MKTRFEHAYVINVLADDHPGIVAAVGSAVKELGGNIDACSQTVLRGYFTLIMVISLPDDTAADDLATRVRELAHESCLLQVMARKLDPAVAGEDTGQAERFVLTAFGEDRPGFLLQFSRYLAGKDINIVDLYGQQSEGEFVLISQVEVPRSWDVRQLQADLQEMGQAGSFTVRFQHENIFVATNQLRLTREMAPGRMHQGS